MVAVIKTYADPFSFVPYFESTLLLQDEDS